MKHAFAFSLDASKSRFADWMLLFVLEGSFDKQIHFFFFIGSKVGEGVHCLVIFLLRGNH